MSNLKQEVLKIISLVKLYASTKYGILGIISFVVISMTGYILISPSYKNVPTHNAAMARNYPTAVPTLIVPTAASISAAVSIGIPPSNTPSPTPTTIPTPTIDPTAGWPTYTNSAYGYTIKYPVDWTTQNISPLEPKVPSYIVFNPKTASASSRSITVSVSNRTYSEQLTIGGRGSPIIIESITGALQYLQDSNGNQSATIVLPRAGNLILLHTKLIYATIFNQMLSTFRLTN